MAETCFIFGCKIAKREAVRFGSENLRAKLKPDTVLSIVPGDTASMSRRVGQLGSLFSNVLYLVAESYQMLTGHFTWLWGIEGKKMMTKMSQNSLSDS